MVLKPSFTEFKPLAIVLPQSALGLTKGKMLEIDMGYR
jgi:hypothetical protein